MLVSSVLRLHAQTHPGRVRALNQDAHSLHPEVGLAAVADGVGGHRAGEIAAALAMALAAQGLAQALTDRPDLQSPEPTEEEFAEIESLMRAVTARAHAAIHEQGRREPSCAGMATTLVMALWRGDDLLVGHIGDSRAYRLRPRQWDLPGGPRWEVELRRLSRDHSGGLATDAERPLAGFGSATGRAGRLTRALGMDGEAVLELHRHRLQPRDIILLCSDGLTDMVDDQRIEQVAQQAFNHGASWPGGPAFEAFAQALLEDALQAGGTDNITLVVGHQVGEPSPT